MAHNNVSIPADVPKSAQERYAKNFELVTKGTGRLMLFAGDQKVEHLNDDFHGTADGSPIPEEDGDPEHLFRIAKDGTIGCFASQYGMIARYGRDYPDVPYLVKLNSKSHLVKTAQKDPVSRAWVTVEQAMDLHRDAGLNVVGVGYTVYLGSEFESEMFTEVAQIIHEAHKHGLLVIIWMYPRGKAVANEKDPHLIAGAAGVAACLGADFVKVNYPKAEGVVIEEAFKEAQQAAGRTRVITAGGSSTDVRKFLDTLHKQIHVSGAHGSATGRNIHQKTLKDALAMTRAISAITYAGKSVDEAMEIFEGKKELKL